MRNKTYKIIWYSLLGIYAFILMLFCAGSSPVINYLSPDSNIFFLMGRAASKGLIWYKDIADHKGMYIFAINWMANIITPDKTVGLFIIEMLFAWAKMICVFEISDDFLHESWRSFISSAVFMGIATNYKQWNTGNLSETYCLLFMLISILLIEKYVGKCYEKGKVLEHNLVHMFIHGICAGLVFFTQLNMVGMWIPFGIALAYALIKSGLIKNFFNNLIALWSGVIMTAIPVFLYAFINDCVEDMFYFTYTFNTIYSKAYSSRSSVLKYGFELIKSPSLSNVLIMV